MNKILVFDLGGVLIINNMFEDLRQLTQERYSQEELRTRWLRSPVVRAFELGQCSATDFADAMIGEFELDTSADRFLTTFSGWPRGYYPGAEQLLRQLRSKYTIACLSNSNSVHWTDKVTGHFDYAYSSHLLGCIKPDTEAFQAVTDDIGCQPGGITYFDDSQLNVDAARAFGWQAHLTMGYEALVDVLQQNGLI